MIWTKHAVNHQSLRYTLFSNKAKWVLVLTGLINVALASQTQFLAAPGCGLVELDLVQAPSFHWRVEANWTSVGSCIVLPTLRFRSSFPVVFFMFCFFGVFFHVMTLKLMSATRQRHRRWKSGIYPRTLMSHMSKHVRDEMRPRCQCFEWIFDGKMGGFFACQNPNGFSV